MLSDPPWENTARRIAVILKHHCLRKSVRTYIYIYICIDLVSLSLSIYIYIYIYIAHLRQKRLHRIHNGLIFINSRQRNFATDPHRIQQQLSQLLLLWRKAICRQLAEELLCCCWRMIRCNLPVSPIAVSHGRLVRWWNARCQCSRPREGDSPKRRACPKV